MRASGYRSRHIVLLVLTEGFLVAAIWGDVEVMGATFKRIHSTATVAILVSLVLESVILSLAAGVMGRAARRIAPERELPAQ